MQDSGYEGMRRLQEYHWWWRGMAHLYTAALNRFVVNRNRSANRSDQRIIDIGCGFGANLPVLNNFGAVVGVDLSLEALQAIRERPVLGLVQARADELPFKAGSFEIVGVLAVIEHVERDDRVLSESFRFSKPGAVQLLNTSAFMVLWSHHDAANRHQRRYRAANLAALQKAAGWNVLLNSYVNVLIFPAVLVVRLVQRITAPPSPAEYDMGPTVWPINPLL